MLVANFFQMLLADVGDFFRYVGDFQSVLNRTPTSQTCHQHIWSPTSVTNIDVTSILNLYLANSTVCLCFHMKKLKNFNKAFFNTSNFAGIQELMLYVRISVGDSSKATKPGEVRKDDGKKIGRNKTVVSTLNPSFITHAA